MDKPQILKLISLSAVVLITLLVWLVSYVAKRLRPDTKPVSPVILVLNALLIHHGVIIWLFPL